MKVINRRDSMLMIGAASLLSSDVTFPAPALAQTLPAFKAALRLGPTQSGAGSHRWAQILGGEVAGGLLTGRAQTGRMDWFVDPCTGAVEVALNCSVVRNDGAIIQLCDRTDHACADPLLPRQGLPTAPQLFAAGDQTTVRRLAGRLDASELGQGLVRLRAFELR